MWLLPPLFFVLTAGGGTFPAICCLTPANTLQTEITDHDTGMP